MQAFHAYAQHEEAVRSGAAAHGATTITASTSEACAGMLVAAIRTRDATLQLPNLHPDDPALPPYDAAVRECTAQLCMLGMSQHPLVARVAGDALCAAVAHMEPPAALQMLTALGKWLGG